MSALPGVSSPVELSRECETNGGVSSGFREASEAGEEITSVNISVGQWSDGLLPIKMMDEPTLAAFSHTHTPSCSLTPSHRPTGQWERKTSLSWDTPRPVVSVLKSTSLSDENAGLSLPFFSSLPPSPFPCSLPHSFLSLVHASGIPLDPLNEGHIAGLAKRGEWERRRGGEGEPR